MPIIVDANVAAVLFGGSDEEFRPVLDALISGAARLVYGGRVTREYSNIRAAVRLIAELDRSGIARQIPDVDAREAQLKAQGRCLSDDEHVIALAQLSSARLLCSRDTTLHIDFTDKRLIDGPRGKVYQTRTHVGLLRTHGQ